mmetsp:Transcript_13750/g.15408  ORF Transcript_13750/g.15408 Transcript_13750/m.15408 type:complete len:117 (+) Transcript_13750:99-449(+)
MKENPILKLFLLTFLCSAVWHGFYPGYYFFFIYYAFFLSTASDIKNYCSWYLNFLPQRLRRFLAASLGFLFTGYVTTDFALYDVRDIIYYHNCQYWHFHIIIMSIFIFSLSPLGIK